MVPVPRQVGTGAGRKPPPPPPPVPVTHRFQPGGNASRAGPSGLRRRLPLGPPPAARCPSPVAPIVRQSSAHRPSFAVQRPAPTVRSQFAVEWRV